MRTIKVSEAVWTAIAERGKFGETEDDVLRRVFALPSENDEQESESPDGRRGRGNRRFAEKKMSTPIEGNRFSIEFDDGAAKSWELPHPSDKEAIRRLLDKATAFAKANGATDPGQTNAVRKALTDAGYYLTK